MHAYSAGWPLGRLSRRRAATGAVPKGIREVCSLMNATVIEFLQRSADCKYCAACVALESGLSLETARGELGELAEQPGFRELGGGRCTRCGRTSAPVFQAVPDEARSPEGAHASVGHRASEPRATPRATHPTTEPELPGRSSSLPAEPSCGLCAVKITDGEMLVYQGGELIHADCHQGALVEAVQSHLARHI